MQADAVVERWSRRLELFIPGFFHQSPALRELWGHCGIIFHGSTTLGIDDDFSDLDLWVLSSLDAVRRAESTAGTRFFSFTLDGKQGHFNLEVADEFKRRVQHCDMERIAELRRSRVLCDVEGKANALVSLAQQPMSDAIRLAWFKYHYIEMRGYHRNADNPIERGNAVALLQALVPTLNHALRAALVLDYEPYPYIKWLGHAAERTPTGQRVMPLIKEVLDLLASDALRCGGPERSHPLSLKMREIRQLLIESAHAQGITEPWLDRWWEHITETADDIRKVNWEMTH
jgi:predicted nucleotidyltransferase